MIIYELPPQLIGTPEEKLQQLRAYLLRLAQQLNEAEILRTAEKELK